jgi:hypothetical protein
MSWIKLGVIWSPGWLHCNCFFGSLVAEIEMVVSPIGGGKLRFCDKVTNIDFLASQLLWGGPSI